MIICSCYDLITAKGNWGEWLKIIAKRGATGTRFFALQVFSQKGKLNPLQPYPVVGIWTHPTIKKRFPLFRLRDENNKKPVWNEKWWKKYRARLKRMKKYGLTAHIVAWTFTDLKKTKNEKYYHPWYCSIEALNEFWPPTPGGVWGQAMKKYKADFLKRLIEEAIEIGVKFTIEPVNEFDAKEYNDEFMINYHQWLVNKVREYGAETIIASAGRNAKKIARQVDIYSCHGIVRPEKIDLVKEKWRNRKRLLISGDGGFDGHGPADAKGRRGASSKEMRGIARKIVEYNYKGYEYFDRALYKRDNDKANLDDFKKAPLSALVDEFRKQENPCPN